MKQAQSNDGADLRSATTWLGSPKRCNGLVLATTLVADDECVPGAGVLLLCCAAAAVAAGSMLNARGLLVERRDTGSADWNLGRVAEVHRSAPTQSKWLDPEGLDDDGCF